MKHTTLLAAVFALATGAALAQDAADSLVADFQAQGYSRIEVKRGPTQARVEAMRGTEKIEIIIDRETGAVLKRERTRLRTMETTAAGVVSDDSGDDFLTGDDDSTDDMGMDDDGSDDNAGDNSGNDADEDGDDGDHGHGSGHGGSDDD